MGKAGQEKRLGKFDERVLASVEHKAREIRMKREMDAKIAAMVLEAIAKRRRVESPDL